MVKIMSTVKNGLTRQKGFSIMEVLIAIVIFAIGMIALAQLQGNLTRSSANANVRTVATNLAEETIENLRGFARMDTDPGGVVPAYADITTTSALTETRGGIEYSLTTTVNDWYYEIVSDSFMEWDAYTVAYKDRVGGNSDPPDSFSDFKQVSVNVAWDDTRPWLIDESTSFTGATSITLSAVISSMTSGASSKVVTQVEQELYVPYVDYNPGQNPDVISLALDGGKFKESLTPEPEVYRDNELVETRFDVVTYSQSGGSSLFVRREEFISLSCECTLKAPPGDPENAGRRPTMWAGDEYSEALFVNKPYGVSSLGVNAQSAFCDVCCQDHHDGGSHEDDSETATTRYDPFPKSSRVYSSSPTFSGDHKHYFPNASGVLTEVTSDGDTYMESCALVRRNGFMRVIQDFNQEGVNAFAQDFLDDVSEAVVYSTYVTGAVSTYVAALSTGYESSPPTFAPPATGLEATDLWSDYTTLPLTIADGLSTTELTEQQLSNRGIYIGYLSNDLQYVMGCVTAEGGSADTCESGDVKLDQTGSTNILEMVPFFDVQLTKLSRWNETPINNPVDTTNEPIATDNLHSRGLASPGGRMGLSLVSAKGHPGNIGLTDTDPVEPNFTTTSADITVESKTGDTAIDPTFTVISGTITSSVGGNLDVTLVVIAASEAQCDRTVDGFTCAFIAGASPIIELTGYGRDTKSDFIDRVACSTLTKTGESFSDINPWARFSLAGASESILYNINIAKATTCGGGLGG